MNGIVISGSREVTKAAIQRQARQAAKGLAARGATGGRVALLLRNDAEFITASEAARLAGAAAVVINWHFSAAEIEYVLRDCGASIVIAHSDLWRALSPTLSQDLRDGLQALLVKTPAEIAAAYRIGADACVPPADAQDWDLFCDAHEPIESPVETAVFPIIYTSGTTGNPKGVQRLGPSRPSKHGYDAIFEPGIKTLVSAPAYHGAPNRFIMGSFHAGGTVVLPPRFDAEETLKLIDKHRITVSFVVPTMLNRIIRLPADVRQRYDLSSLRHVVTAGAPCPPVLKEQIIAWWGPVLYEYYGSTESGALTYCTSADALARPGTVGKVTPNARVEIVDEAGNRCPPGVAGEIYGVRTDFPDFTYLNDPEARAEVGRDDLTTSGDVGYLDEDGYLFLNDRRRDMIIAGGVNIYPAHIEAALHEHPEVIDCAVFGIPDPDLGEAVAAAVQTHEGRALDLEALRAHLAERIGKYMIPELFTFTKELPRTELGKVRKRELREAYWRDAERKI